MNSKLIKILVPICFILMLIIGFEWLYGKQMQEQIPNSINAETSPVLNDEMPQIELNKLPENSYEDWVNRPLFIADRKPIAEVKTTDEQSTAVSTNFGWRLSGIYTTRKGLMALFTKTGASSTPQAATGTTASKTPSTNKYRKLIVGDTIDDWKVAKIHQYEVILTLGEMQKKLPLRQIKAKVIQEQNVSTPPNAKAAKSAMSKLTNDVSEEDDNTDN